MYQMTVVSGEMEDLLLMSLLKSRLCSKLDKGGRPGMSMGLGPGEPA